MAHAQEKKQNALNEKHCMEKKAMKKEHSEHIDRHKAAIEQQKKTIKHMERSRLTTRETALASMDYEE